MHTLLHVSGRGRTLSDEEQRQIQAAVTELERFYDRLVSCRVTVTVLSRVAGGDPVSWSIRMALTVPGGELAVSRQAKPSFHEALTDAMSAARRQLQDFVRHSREPIWDAALTGAV